MKRLHERGDSCGSEPREEVRGYLAFLEAERLAHPQTRVEEQQHERMGHRAFALSSGNFEGEAGSRDARS